jgi:AraC family transcriptional regulator
MVSESCCKVIRWELERTGFVEVEQVELGSAIIHFNEGVINLDFIDAVLKRNGFSLIEHKDEHLIEQIKAAVIQLIFYGNNTNTILRNSDYLSQKLGQPYPVLSKLFSKQTQTTLEKYIIQIKIEKVKELIRYDEYSLSEIAYMMGYSSVAHLSNQFRQVTGLTVQEFKKDTGIKRTPLNKL